jgi:ATP-binding cassette, subfamily C, bacterial CydD
MPRRRGPARAAGSERADRRLLRETRAGRRQFVLAGGLGAAMAVTIVAQASLVAHVIARVAVDHAGLRALGGSLAALAGAIVARAVLSGAFEASGRIGATRVMSELRGRLAAKLLSRAPVARERERTGELATAAVQGIDALEAYFAGYLPQLVLAAAVPLAVLAWILPLDPIAAVLLAVTIPLLIVFMILVGKGAQAQARSRWRALALLGGHFLDVVQGLETLRAHRREAAQVATIERIGERYRAETMGTLRVAFLSALVLELCAMVGTALVAATIGIQLDGGHLTLEAGLTVLLLAPELYGPLRAVGQQFHASSDGLASAERIFAVLDEPTPVAAARRASRLPDPAREPVRFEHVSFCYPDRCDRVLCDVEIRVRPGELTALTGASGSGKSTLAALALRLVDPTAGRVTCGGVDLRDIDPAAWHRRVAWVPQRTRLFSGTIAANIALSEPDASRRRVLGAARSAGLIDLLAGLADGLETRIGDGGRGLSAGQAQRIGLARAFLHEASLVVLDEPTAHLDADTTRSMVAAIRRLAVGRTMLVVAHDAQVIACADHLVAIDRGRVQRPALRVAA